MEPSIGLREAQALSASQIAAGSEAGSGAGSRADSAASCPRERPHPGFLSPRPDRSPSRPVLVSARTGDSAADRSFPLTAIRVAALPGAERR